LSFPYMIAALLLMASLGWALYDEYFGTRPWKDYQHRFVAIYTSWLEKNFPKQAAAQKAIEQSDKYKQLDEALKEAEKAAGPDDERIREQLDKLAIRKSIIDDMFQSARG